MTALTGWVRANAPISVENYMAECAGAYYAARDPLGRGGDFITAPEVSQMFGELIGAWMADMWQRAGEPRVHLAELGPGRGTLMADLLRAARPLAEVAHIHFIETSPALRRLQAKRVPAAQWHDAIDGIPADAPLLLVANEFFDVLPVRQAVHIDGRWHERMVDVVAGKLAFVPQGDAIRETSPARKDYAAVIAARLAAQGGAALIIDYGYGLPVRPSPQLGMNEDFSPKPLIPSAVEGRTAGDTLQAVRNHKSTHPLATPGEADITAHVDFADLARAAAGAGARVSPLTTQRAFLAALGIDRRLERLTRDLDAEAVHAIAGAVRRLTAPQAMGEVFKVLALYGPHWPEPAGF